MILTAHCVLNQNSVIRDWERAPGAFNDIVRILLKDDIGIIQLPCPEFSYQGESRPPKTKAEYDTSEYRAHCNTLATGVVSQLKEYIRHDYEILGFIGIQESPSCDTKIDRGIFVEVFFKLLEKAEIELNTIDIPVDYLEGNGVKFLENLDEFIKRD